MAVYMLVHFTGNAVATGDGYVGGSCRRWISFQRSVMYFLRFPNFVLGNNLLC